MKVIIAGTRTFNDYQLLCNTIKELNINIDEIVCGGAKGADALGEKYAKENNISSKEIKDKIKNNTGEWAYGYAETYNSNSNEPVPLMIDQYDLEGNFIKTWNSYSECRKEHPNVKQVLTGGRKQTHGYTFKIHK